MCSKHLHTSMQANDSSDISSLSLLFYSQTLSRAVSNTVHSGHVNRSHAGTLHNCVHFFCGMPLSFHNPQLCQLSCVQLEQSKDGEHYAGEGVLPKRFTGG